MNLTEQIKECKAKIVELEFNLAVERAVLARLTVIGDGQQAAISDEPRPIIRDSIVAPIQSVLNSTNKPMKVAQLLKAIKQQDFHFHGKTEPKRLISSALNRRSDLFERVGRGLYDLKSRDKEVIKNDGQQTG
jgi:hypothetical protein